MDRLQKVLHGSKTAQSKTSPVVALPLAIQLPPSSQTREIHGQARCAVSKASHGTGSNDNSNIVLLPSKLFTICAVEGLEFFRPERDVLRDIHKESKQLDQAGNEEPVAKAVRKLRKSSSRSLHSAEWL